MHRVDTATAVAVKPAKQPAGTPGYFTKGDPAQDIPATIPGADFWNTMQGEMVNVILQAGLSLNKSDDTQLFQAINKIIYTHQLPIGTCLGWPTDVPPTGFLERDGSLLSMTSYEGLYDTLGTMNGIGAGTVCTFSSVTDLVNATGHGLGDDTVLELTNSGGGLPAELAVSTKYYVVNAAADTFQLSLVKGGVPIDFTDDGTGTHNFHTQFQLMDDRGLFDRYWDHGAAMDPDRSTRTDRGDGTTGDYVGTRQGHIYELHDHPGIGVSRGHYDGGYTHTLSVGTNAASYSNYVPDVQAAGGNETRPKNRYKMAIIKSY